MLTPVTLLRGARQLLTLRGTAGPRRGPELSHLGIIIDGAALIRDGVLVEVGPSRRVENLAEARNAVEINAAGKIVLPGFVDSHTHLLFPPPDAPESDAQAAARVIADQTASSLRMRAHALIDAMARHGTTTVEVKTGSGLDENGSAKLLKVLAALHQDPLTVRSSLLLSLPSGGGDALDEAEAWISSQLLPKIWKRKLTRFADIAWSGGAERQEHFRRVMQSARTLGFTCRVHAHEAAPDSAIRLAVGQEALSVDHLEHAVPADAALLSRSKTMATLLPSESFLNGSAGPPARSLIDCGVPVALASNYHSHFNPTLNMQSVIAMACLRLGLTPAEAITAATINAAYGLGIGDRVGSLEPGKNADFVVLNVRDYRDLAHTLGANLTFATVKNGQVIYREGEVAARARVPPGRALCH